MTTPFTDTFRRPSVARPSKDAALNTKHGAVVELEDKALTESQDFWTVTGYAAAFNNKDRGGDIIVPGAFAKSLRENGLPLLLFQHKIDEAPVGAVVEAKEDRRGLWIKAVPRDDDFVRRRLIPQLKRRGLKGMSIGYKAVDTEFREADRTRLLKEITLYECSFVSLPMNPAAGVESISKAAGDEADIIDAVRALREVFQGLVAESVKARADLAALDAAMATRSVTAYDLGTFMADMREISAAARSLRSRW